VVLRAPRAGKRGSSAERYLASQTLYGVKFGLETTEKLCAALAHPERAYPCLLVAGTNGKGSVVAYTDGVLRASRLRVGRYTSPHLVRVHERIVVNGREITEAQLERAVGRVQKAAEALVARGEIPAHPTYFETMTVAAFDHFRAQKVDVAVLEVGMGGRLDSTNVSSPVASAIVTIAKDHEAFLGRTLARIAREKAGVLRRGRPTVVGRLPREALKVVRAAARSRHASLVPANAGAEVCEAADGVTITTPRGRYVGLRPLPGEHQRANLLVAIRLLEAAQDEGIPVDLSVVREGVARTRWRGRLEWVPGRPPLLLDGAHNPAGAQALAGYLKTLPPFVLVFGVMADKDVPGVAKALFPLARAVVLTRPNVRRAATPRAIRERAGAWAPRLVLAGDARSALARARALARGAPVVVAGSLYLVGEVLALLSKSRK
jgi:dihydrofolate synthase/folylpolyglutamate synthase